MAENNGIKTITCTICTKFCQNGDEKKLNKLIEEIKDEGFEKVIFSCDFLKNYHINPVRNLSLNRGKEQRGVISNGVK
ncbi:MAG: hypothetical protein WC619_04040 [Patescibacteria group bacterium]